jgi:general secretion pathway protein C
MIQRYFWLAYLILITLGAALTANMATSYIGAKLATPVAAKIEQTSGVALPNTRPAANAYSVITDRNIFNANPPDPNAKPPEEAPKPPPVPVDIQETQLQLKLVGTVIGENYQYYAIIEDLTNRGFQALYQVGDAIQNALIADIRPKCVVFDKGGQYESLCFPQESPTNPNQTPEAQSTFQAPPSSNEEIVRVDNATWQVSRELMQEQFNNLGSLSTQARVMPYMIQGVTQGFRLSNLKPDGLLPKIGLRHGDVLQKVNGQALTSPADALQAYQQLQQSGTVRLEIIRQNRPTILTYEIR